MLLGQLLLAQGALTQPDIDRALAEQARVEPAPRLGTLLIRHGVVSETTLYEALTRQLGLPQWQAGAHEELQRQAAAALGTRLALPEALARRWLAFTCPQGTAALALVACDPLQPELLEHVQRLAAGRIVQPMLATSQEMLQALAALYIGAAQAPAALAGSIDLRRLAQDAPIVAFVASLLARGTDLGASDIHVEAAAEGFAIRYRVDGELGYAETHARAQFDAVVSRIKLIAGLDIAERRLPQDGRFSTRAAGIDTEVRVSVIPGVQGESVVLRLLPKTAQRRFQLDALGLEADHLALLGQWLGAPDGIILVTGPTGSGKSTTLYAALAATDVAGTRVLTVEDPVEYQLPGVTQFQVQADIGFTFPAALRAILRHDPDTIMIGEIRDTETARIAIQASLTGHKVLSTLHTNDAASAYVRLVDMGIEPFLLAASVRGVIAQRLIRRHCRHCAVPLPLAELPPKLVQAAAALGLDAADYRGLRPVGCARCSGTGYRGRTGVHEFLPTTDRLRQLLAGGDISPRALRACAPARFRPLQHDGLLKFWQGQTSVAEVLSLPSGETALEAEP